MGAQQGSNRATAGGRPRVDIKPTQVVAGALASVTAAVVGSQLGVEGTIWGAAVGSVVSTVGATIYQYSWQRTSDQVRERGWLRAREQRERAERQAGAPPAERPPVGRGRPSWPRFGLLSAVIFVVGMVVVTGIELARGRPLSDEGTGTTIGTVTKGHVERGPGGTPPVDSTEPNPTTTGKAGVPGQSSAVESSPPSDTGESSSDTGPSEESSKLAPTTRPKPWPSPGPGPSQPLPGT